MCRPVLLIDIDDTLIHQTPETGGSYALLELIRQQACRSGLTPSDVGRRVQQVLATTYWGWNDFLDCLGLGRTDFWRLADEVEARRTRRIDNRIESRLFRLQQHGYRLAIASNNPVDGIQHKLRLAGIAPRQQQALFSDYFGTDNSRSNKAEVAFWRYVVDQLRVPPERVSVVGDNPVEDGQVPRHVGIQQWIPIRGLDSVPGQATWSEVEQRLLDEIGSASAADG